MMHIPTPEESRVSKLLEEYGIFHPWQLQIENVCNVFDIDLEMGLSSTGFCYMDYKMITLNKRKNEKQRQFEFFHELAHLLFHSGDQDKLPENIVHVQEWQASRLALYLSIPYHMLHYIKMSNPDVIQETSNLFNLPEDVVCKRLTQIKNNLVSKPIVV